uniref:Neural cell adhesion molecule L1 n=1 Tax=Anabas testudineus TaxID=64144 RepID=A0A7N6BTT0_ANATE
MGLWAKVKSTSVYPSTCVTGSLLGDLLPSVSLTTVSPETLLSVCRCLCLTCVLTSVCFSFACFLLVPPLQQKEKKVTVKSEQGSSIVLKCNPPQSSMEPIIHWMDSRLHHIQLNQRVVVGKDGNLYFAHLTPEDSRNDYTCNVQYLATRTILAKEPITLTVTPSNSVVRNKRPQMMRPSSTQSTYHVLRGQTVELECIVQGLPTPDVMWLRKDGELFESRTTKDMFDRRLRFNNISESDAGEYQCRANNSQGKITHTYTVIVEAAPYWLKEPVSQLYAPGETVRLDCQADGIPTPTISWTVNGLPLPATEKESRHTLTASGSLILNEVKFKDTAIYQCRASNKHGTILTNTNVYVVELPPQILTEDGNTYTFAEGQKALLECETFGSPKPQVKWMNNGYSTLLADPRVNLLTNGGLEISNVTHDDEGFYTCSVQNTNLSISAELEVLNRTVILSPPQALKVQPGNTAIFTCLALVDPKLESPLIQWRKDNQKLFESSSDENVQVVVIMILLLCRPDRPDPPILLQITDPRHRAVTLNWTPGDDHNSPVLEYVIEFEDQGLKDRGWEQLLTVSGNKEYAALPLWPNMSYRFRVIAINEVGKSDPSKPSEIHSTHAEAPDNNPEDVRSESTDPGTLVITWKEMEKQNFNGPDFKYKVMWRKVVGSGPNWHTDYTTEPPVVVDDVGNFSAFEIKVQAVNKKGEGPEPDPVIGYSGEDVPLEAPMDVGVLLINSTSIKVTWAAVERETVRGHLLGYKVIYLTRLGSRDHHRGRRTAESESTVVVWTGANEEKKVISNLRPYSHYVLTIKVFNSKGEGPNSEPLSFKTDEGGKNEKDGEKRYLGKSPGEPNGVLIGLCASADGSKWKKTEKVDSSQSFYQLQGLTPGSHYRLLFTYSNTTFWETEIKTEGTVTEMQPSFATQGWFIGVVSAVVLLLLILLILCFIKRSKGGKYSVKDKEDGPMDSEARPMKDETFGEYSDLEEKRTASQPSLCEESKLCSVDNLDFNGSSAITTELNMDESLVSQFSRPSEGLPDNSPLNPTTVSPATNGLPNSVTILD